jgi:hypothetical protein
MRLFGIGRFPVVLLVDPLVVLRFDLLVGARIERSAGSSDAGAVCRLGDFQTSLRHIQFRTLISPYCRLGGGRSH